MFPGYLKILEIPKGARHLLIQEFKGTPHILGKNPERIQISYFPLVFLKHPVFLCPATAMKNQDTGHLFLNDEHELPESRAVIEKGVAWEYRNTEEEEEESIQTTGPLKYGVVLMVSPSVCEAQSVSNTNQNYQRCLLPVRSVLMATQR